MSTFAGVDHVSLSVTDLDRSQGFYTEVLGFLLIYDFGDARSLIHPDTGFRLALVRHPAGAGDAFSELHTGLDHLGLRAADRHELEQWVARLDAAGVTYTPIRDLPFGSHLNFRDPDDIPLELYVPSETMTAALDELRERRPSREEIDRRARELMDAAYGTPEGEGLS